MLKIDNISKQFGKKQVLKDVSLELNPGERIHIIGKNGSGKSTIFKIITNILKADAGQVELAENDYVGALIENPGFLEYESGLENLKFLGNLNHNYDEQVAMKLMEKFDLDPNDLQAVSKYSIGMRQKLGIIQAVMENQNIVLLDELKQEKSAVIIASHDEIPGLKYDRELLLKNGELASV